ncbi:MULTISPECIES: hypothetical protein [Flavobacteriaceae]|uniref:DUF4870 domain-containing protein n=1 Tax=Flagellimonas alvinocaridis TaxID=2530200 RepID=A0A4S8RS24_9FLAO|nr:MULTISPECIES: hypothetical protein [Allomuricauda]MDC6363466.1 hypothetical protein [Muricauda sp. SP22]THV57939.1 hypothetical protein EZV76_13695 [Allomuricauda alvinocaridis]
MNEAKSGKTTAIVAYITLVGCLIAMSMNMEPRNAYARFHIRQAFGIHLLFHAMAIVLSFSQIVSLTLPLYGLYLVLLVYGLAQASSGKKSPLPIIGEHFQKWFTFIS